jgi:hypothetical protein
MILCKRAFVSTTDSQLRGHPNIQQKYTAKLTPNASPCNVESIVKGQAQNIIGYMPSEDGIKQRGPTK